MREAGDVSSEDAAVQFKEAPVALAGQRVSALAERVPGGRVTVNRLVDAGKRALSRGRLVAEQVAPLAEQPGDGNQPEDQDQRDPEQRRDL